MPLGSALGFYYPPDNVPPGPPPNYTQIDTSYFKGVPPLPVPPPTMGGFYIWWDNGVWNIANHIYSLGNTLEQFHGSILAVLEQPPQLNINVFITDFELWGDTVSSMCMDQNDRWGWVQWDTDLYEIWWDVTTKEKRTTGEDLNDFIEVKIAGCAIDFNLWSSAHGGPFGPDQVYLGGDMVPLSSIPEYSDAFVGIDDPYQFQAGLDPENDPNITIFTPKTLPGASYNKFGQITIGETYPCYPGYGERFTGSFAYEGNGIQFSTGCTPADNEYPNINFPVGTKDTTYFVCVTDSVCVTVVASDPDVADTVTLELLQGPVTYGPVTAATIITDEVCFFPDTSGTYRFIWQATDNHGATAVDTVDLLVTLNTPPVLIVPADTAVHLCAPAQICVNGIWAYDIDSATSGAPTVEMISGFGSFEPSLGQVCFTPDTAGTYGFVFRVCDTCLEPAVYSVAAAAVPPALVCPEDTLYVTVTYNQPPYINPPPTPDPIVCVPANGEVCITGWQVGDPDGDKLAISTMGSGTFDRATGTFCTHVSAPGSYTQTLIVSDSCGATVKKTLTFQVVGNQPPVVAINVPGTSVFCTPDTVCLDVTISDADDTLLETWSNIGVLRDGQICFAADTSGTYTVIVAAADPCGNETADTAHVPVQLNNPPYIEAPDTTWSILCASDSVACFTDAVFFGDPDQGDSLTLHLPIGVTYDDSTGTLCVPFTETGWYEVIIGVTDRCGITVWDTIQTDVVVNDAPVISFSIPDTTIYTCSPDTQICFYVTAEDAAGHPVVIEEILNPGFFDASTGLACFNPDSICFEHPLTIDTTICVIFRATGECGSTIDSLCIQFVSNRPPIVQMPPDTTVTVCDYSEICVGPVIVFDPDDEIPVITGFGARYDNGKLCFTPEGEGSYVVGVEVVDSCGHVVRDSLTVNVVLNRPPLLDIPDTLYGALCGLGEVCVGPIYATDPEGDPITLTLLEGAGSLDPATSEICLVPEVGAVYRHIVAASDSCGSTVDTFWVKVDINQPPVWTHVPDTSVRLCAPGDSICFEVTATDPNGEILTYELAPLPTGPFMPFDGSYCFTPDLSGTYLFVVRASDSCNAAIEDTVNVNVTFNTLPEISFSLPDTTINVCSPDTVICFNVFGSDIDADEVTLREILNPGMFNAETGEVCFNPDSICFDHPGTIDTTICLIFGATDWCGIEVVDTLCLHIVTDQPPVVELPPDQNLLLCGPQQVCVEVGIPTDPDGDPLNITVTEGAQYRVGEFNETASICFDADTAGTYELVVCATDSCGLTGCDTMLVTVDFNHPPVISWVDDFTVNLCQPGEVCVPAAFIDDRDGGSLVVDIIGAEDRGSEYCFWAGTAGVHTIIVTATDSCGAADIDTVKVTVQLNTPPSVLIRSPKPLRLCDIDTVLCYPLTISDMNGDKVTLSLKKCDLDIFSLNGNSICVDAGVALAGRDSVNCVATIVATDPCGASSETTFRLILTANKPPFVSLPPDTTITLCEPQDVCIFPVTYGDPNGEKLAVQIGGGDLVRDSICNFVDHDTTITVTVTVTDSCGVSATDTTLVHVVFDKAPALVLPEVGSLALCALQEVCIDGIYGNDPELGTIPAELISGPGSFDPATGKLCFIPDANGLYEWTFMVTDGCHADTGILHIDVTTNQPPVFGDSPDTSVFACLPGDTICIQFDATDPDGDPVTYSRISSVGTIDPATGRLCFAPDTAGLYQFIVSAADTCGSAVDTGYVAVRFNSAPEIAFSSSDTSIYVCNPDTLLCFTVSAWDADGEIPTIREILNPGFFDPETGEFCFNPDSVCFDDPMTVDTTFCLIFAASDDCGAETVDTLCIQVTRNRPPTVNLGPDTTVFLCEPDTFCLDLSQHVFDPDYDTPEITIHMADYLQNGSALCVAMDTSGVYQFIVCATDPCGLETCDTMLVTVTVNSPPVVQAPPDSTVIACQVDEVCVPGIIVYDPDLGDVPTVTVSGGATLSNGTLCFNPASGDGVYTFIITATDGCGATAEDTLMVTVDANDAPTLSFLTPDTSVTICNPDTELCFRLMASDPDGDAPVVEPILLPGFFDPLTNTFCVYPDSICFDAGHRVDTTICVIFRATDACGAQVIDSMCISLVMNKPPQVHFSVPDTTLFLCNPDTLLCFDVWGTDPEGDPVTITEVLNPGVFYPEIGQFCFNPDSICFGNGIFDHTMCLKFAATDECGNTTVDSLCIELIANRIPVVTAPDTVDAIICALGAEVCVTGVSANDLEDGILDVSVPGATYDLATGNFCFVADSTGTYVFTASATDYCEKTGSKQIVVNVTLNQAPHLSLPADTAIFYCGADITCFDWSLSDPEGDSLSIDITGPAYVDTSSGQLCVRIDANTPVEIVVTVTDRCGASATDTLVVTPAFNTPPVLSVPFDTTVRVCEPGAFCIGPVSVTDIDGNFTGDITVSGGWYDSLTSEVCVDITADGRYTAIITATDECGATDIDTVIIDATINVPPVTDFNVPDTSLYLCTPDTLLCFVFSATDPDGGSVVLNEILNPGTFNAETGEFCFRPSDVCFTDPTIFDTTLCLIFSASDDCGATTIDSVCLQITANANPVVLGPADTTVSLCNPDTVCLGPFDIYDPNGLKDDLSITVTGPEHVFDAASGTICFLATEGDYTFVVEATDRCGAMAADTVRAHVTGNTAPVITLPADFTEKVCQGGSICVPVTISDPDVGDSLTVTVISGNGIYDPGTGEVCFTPAAAGNVTLVVAVQDLCGVSDQDTITVTVTVNRKPFWTQVPSVDTSVCTAPAQLCYELIASDPDGDAVKYRLISGPGSIDSVNGILCFNPGPATATYTFVVQASDICGAAALDTAVVTVNVNRAPVFGNPPRDTLVSQCAPEQICMGPLSATDPDGDALVYRVLGPLGSIVGNMFCFTPDTLGAGLYCFKVEAKDPCGKADTTQFCAQVTVNRPPVIQLPADFTEAQCNPGEVCFNDIRISDPDGQGLTVTKVSGPGTYNASTGQVCFNPGPTGGVFTFVLRVVDPCGVEDRDTIVVTVKVNSAPSLIIPGTVAGCVDSTICFEVGGQDADPGDVLTIVQMSGPGSITPNPINGASPVYGTWCWDGATEGTSEVVFRVTDHCGAVSYDTTFVVVQSYCDTVCFVSDIEVICPDSLNPNHWLFQGRPYNFSVNTQVNRPVAAFDFLIGYDATALTINGVSKGADISSWEYFTYRVIDPTTTGCAGICPSGMVRIIGIADISNGRVFTDSAQIQPGGGPREFARVSFNVSNDRTLAGQFIPIQFWWNDCGDNTFSSPDGILYASSDVDPDTCVADGAKTPIEACALFNDGGGCIPRASDIDDLGDINLNGFAYEIGDAVLYTNYFIFGASVLDPNPIYRESQIAASDVNGDGKPLTLADLVFLIQVIIGNQEPIGGGGVMKVVPPSGHGTLTFGESSNQIDFALNADGIIGGIAVSMAVEGIVDDVVLTEAAIAAGMELKWHQEGTDLRILMYGPKGQSMAAGSERLFTIKGAHNPLNISGDLAGARGNLMSLDIASGAPLPNTYVLEQNYPNPFNPETEIQFILGSDARVRLTIYNLLGQPVSVLVNDEWLTAGEYRYRWSAAARDGSSLPSGVYMYRLQANDFVQTKKMLLLR